MSKNLVIVESPTKAKILRKILGKSYTVESSSGHIRDLPEKKDHLSEAQKKLSYARLGIDVDNDFKPLYCSPPAKKKNIQKLKGHIKDDTVLYLATDEDREGEAIAWHLNEILNPKKKLKVYRTVFHEITKKAIVEAFENPRELDMEMVEAQQARRILDRLVGYKLSPLLWKKIRFGLSAGRVQSAVVRIIVDREEEIKAFVPQEYWSITGQFNKDGIDFEANFQRKNGEKYQATSEEEANAVLEAIKSKEFDVDKIEKRQVKKNPSAPFITSTLQQDASRKLGFSVKRTMQLAQKLYEGVDLKKEGGATGLITYMRTDSVNLSQQALEETKAVLGELYGPEYQLDKPRAFKTKSKAAQEAHEAIRPTDVRRKPESLKGILDDDMLKLYDLIWKRTLATQAPQAHFDAISADLVCNGHMFRATGQTMTFPGYMRIYVEGSDQPEELLENKDKLLPKLDQGEMLKAKEIIPKQHFTKPPARYTEASLVRKLEDEGIGRPSTYAPTISTVQSRGYVKQENKALHPTDTADVVNGLLVEHFPNIVDLKFTAKMEDDLDEIAEGKVKHIPFLHNFYDPFIALIEEKDKSIKKEDVVNEPTDEKCEECGADMVIKLGRMGKFLSCTDFPKCKHAKAIGEDSEERKALIEKYKGTKCPECNEDMVVKGSRYGDFLACSAYPKCKKTLPILVSTGVTCPLCEKEELIVKKGKARGRTFYGCGGYPDCDYISRFKPVRNSDRPEKGYYVEKKGEEVFEEFDLEAYLEQKKKYEERKKKKEEADAKKAAEAKEEEEAVANSES